MVRFFCFSLFLCCAAAACQRGGKPSGDDNGILLNSPPYGALTDSIRRFPGDATLYLRRAAMLTQRDLHELAAADYSRSWAKGPAEQTAIQYAANLSILNKAAGKLDLLQEAVEKFPHSAGLRRLLGDSYAEAGQAAHALEIYDRLLAVDSLDFETWYEKGLLLAGQKDTLQAIAAIGRAFSLQPVHTYGLELAHLYAERKDMRALKICDAILAADPSAKLPDPFFIKGIYFSNLQQYAAAIVAFDSCIQREWTFTDAYIEKGIAFFKMQRYDTAMRTFQLASQVSHVNADAYYWMGRCLEQKHQNQEALLMYQRAAALDRNFLEARQRLRQLQGS